MSEHDQLMDMQACLLSEMQAIHASITKLAEAISSRATPAAAVADAAVAKAKKSSKPQPAVGENTGSSGSAPQADVSPAPEAVPHSPHPVTVLPTESEAAALTIDELQRIASAASVRLQGDKSAVRDVIVAVTGAQSIKAADPATYPKLKAALEAL